MIRSPRSITAPRWSVLFVLSVTIIHTASSQTKLWDFSGLGKQVRASGDGGTFVTRSVSSSPTEVWGGPDTLFKLDASGGVEWAIRLESDRSRIYPAPGGVYVISAFPSDTLYRYGPGGDLLWTYAHPIPHSNLSDQCPDGTPLVDPSGNFLYPAVDRTSDETGLTGISGSLVELSPTGTVLFEITLPSVAAGLQPDGIRLTPEFQGPVVDRSGNIWMVISTEAHRTMESASGIVTERSRGSMDVLCYDGVTGSLRFRKTVLDLTFAASKAYPDGRYQSTATHFPFIERLLVGSNRLVGYGTDGLYTDRVSPRGSRSKGQNWWSALVVTTAGEVRWLKFKGKGKETWGDRTDWTISDGSSNYLEQAWVGNDDALYLDGEISRGRSKNGVGILHYDHALLRVGPGGRVEWKKVYPDGSADYRNRFFHHRGEDRVMLSSPDYTQMTVIDRRGAESTLPLSFASPLHYFTEFTEGLQHANTEAGSVYGRSSASEFPGGWSIEKYSIPPVAFGPAASGAESGEDPGIETALTSIEPSLAGARNYPNPFNPATTISFHLGEDALTDVSVHNVLGQEVARLASNELFLEGENEVEFDGSGLPSGVYFFRIKAVGLESNRLLPGASGRMVLAK